MTDSNSISFKSRKDIFFTFIYYGVMTLLVATLSIMILTKEHFEIPDFFGIIGLLLFIGILSWFFFDTSYELTTEELKYKVGPIKGKIKVDVVSKIIVGKTRWTGLRVATAREGLIIIYNGFSEIYISPDSNEDFMKEILKTNPSIEIENN